MQAGRLIRFFLPLLILLEFTAAQDRASGVAGSVRDESGASVAAAAIHVRNLNTGLVRNTLSDEAGDYRITALEPGEYEVTAARDGFTSSIHTGVILQVDRLAVVRHVLRVGDSRQQVTVTGEARIVEATSSTLSGVVTRRTIQELPLNGRDYTQLAISEAGAPPMRSQFRNVNNGFGLQISIAGSRPYQNGFNLDGISLNGYSNSTPGSVNGLNLGVEAIQEFSVQSTTFSAQYGRAAGGVVNAVTKSGGAVYHGSAYYFHRNDNMDARNYFDPESPPEFRRHQYGGSAGGPIVGDRAFFFANYEGLRQLRGHSTIDTTISDSAREGVLASGVVPVEQTMAELLALYPRPNGQILGDTGLFHYSDDTEAKEDFLTTRIDLNHGDFDRVFFRYSLDDGEQSDLSNFALGRRRNRNRSQSAVIEEMHIFSPQVLNTARFGFSRVYTAAGETTTLNPATDSPALSFLPGSQVVGVIEVGGLSEFPGGTGALDADKHAFNSFQIIDDLSVTRGRHSLKVGGRFERTQFNTNSQSRVSGEYRFSGVREMLTNEPDRYRAQLPGSDTVRGFRQWIGALYIHDTWTPHPRLTLDLGLRHEWTTVPSEVNGKIANLDELSSPEMRIGAPLFDNPSLLNFAPRAGLAWDIFGAGRTTLRGGYGIYPDLMLSHHLLLAGVRNPPFFLRGSTRAVTQGDFPKGGYQVFIDNPDTEFKVERIPRSLNQPYVQQWNVNVEQLLPLDTSVRVAYIGSHGLNLSSVTDDANHVPAIILPDGRRYYPEDGEKLNPNFSAIRNRNFDAHSFYHGLHALVKRRFSRGVQFQASYRFSKSIDDSSNFFGVTEALNAASLPVNDDPRFNRGLSGHDVRHYFVFSGLWRLPSPSAGPWRAVFGDWQASGIVTFSSGLPATAWLGYDGARTGANRDDWRSGQRPDLAPGASKNPVTGDPDGWIDTTAFRRPEPGFQGNLGRNTIIGPGAANTDFSLAKTFPLSRLRDGASVEFRAEFFNLFNHSNFDLPEPSRMEVFTADSAREDAGRITSAGPSREVQLGLRFRF